MLHVFITWVIANLIHPLFILVFWADSGNSLFDGLYLDSYFSLLLFSFLFSSPLLIISWIIFHFISRSALKKILKFMVWTIVATVSPSIAWGFIDIMFSQGELFSKFFEINLPASLSVLLTILLRYQYFFDHLQELAVNETNHD